MVLGSRIDGIALSAESRLLYFADSSRNEIGVMTLDGRFKKIVINQNLSNPRALVLDEANGQEIMQLVHVVLL